MVPDVAGLLGVQVRCTPSFSMQAQQTNMWPVALCKDNLSRYPNGGIPTGSKSIFSCRWEIDYQKLRMCR